MTLLDDRFTRTAREAVAPARPEPVSEGPSRTTGLALLALTAALVPLRDLWAAQAALVVLLFAVPGACLLGALRVPRQAVTRFPVYLPAASVVVLTAAALAVDLLRAPLGIAAPLRTVPVGLATLALCLALLAVAAGRAPLPPIAQPVRRAWPLLLPLLAAAGAARLTAGHGSLLAVVAVASAGIAIVATAMRAGRASDAQLGLVLYGAGLALTWAYTLRGHFVYGYDITGEWHLLSNTISSGVWRPDHHNDAYGAMTSLTILPASLSALTGLSSLTILKVVYPTLLAFVPVGLFMLARRFLPPRWAFVVAAFLVVQSYFFQQMPAVARQEIGLLLFAALVGAVFERRLGRPSQVALVAVLGLGVVTGHYTTAYVATAIFVVTLLFQAGASLATRRRLLTPAVATACVALGAGAAAWYGPITHSSSNLSSFSSSLRAHGLDLLPNAGPGGGVLQRYLTGNTIHNVDAATFERMAVEQYAQRRAYVHPLKVASDPRYALQNRTASTPEQRPWLDVAGNAHQALTQVAYLLAIFGAFAMALAARRGSRRTATVGFMALATLLVLAFIRLSGTAATAYNQERAFVQTMFPLAICLGFTLDALSVRWRRIGGVLAVAAPLVLGVMLFNSSGLRAYAAGGDPPTNLNDRGEDVERFYLTAPELASARWASGTPHGSLLYADRYGQLRILAATGRSAGVLNDITPRTLDRHAWVYASRTNHVGRRTRGQIGLSYAVYGWPRLLDERFAVVYTNGTSAVYHR
jgi:uncharacterized membrane protein